MRWNFTWLAFTLAWYPAHFSKKPFSAPLALMVSIISMPATVVPASLPASRICTRVIFMRFFEIMPERTRFASTDASPISVSITLYLSMTTR